MKKMLFVRPFNVVIEVTDIKPRERFEYHDKYYYRILSCSDEFIASVPYLGSQVRVIDLNDANISIEEEILKRAIEATKGMDIFN